MGRTHYVFYFYKGFNSYQQLNMNDHSKYIILHRNKTVQVKGNGLKMKGVLTEEMSVIQLSRHQMKEINI